MNQKQHTSPQVSLEDLLRLKRAEQPAPDFWNRFDREMRVKQLAAIVEPRPWWAPFIRISTRMARYQLPVGATAILAMTFLTVREYRLPDSSEAQFGNTVIETTIDTMPGGPVAVVTGGRAAADETALRSAFVDQNQGESTKATPVPSQFASSRTAASPEQLYGMVPMLGGQTSLSASYSPSARAIAANLEAVKANAPDLAQLIERVSGLEAFINAPTRSNGNGDPLSRVQSPSGDSHRSSRLLASALPARYDGNEDSGRIAANRVDRTLTDERLYDSISRFGVKADRVAIKF